MSKEEQKAKGKSNTNASKGKMLQRIRKSSQVNFQKRSRRAHEELTKSSRRAHEELKGKLTEVVTKSSRRSHEQTDRSAGKSV